MASIQKRTNGRWAVRWRDLEGRQRWATFRTRKEALDHRKRVDFGLLEPDESSVAEPAKPTPLTVTDFYEQWLPRQVWRQSTIDQVACHYRKRITPEFGDRLLDTIERSEIQDWVRQLCTALAPSTVHIVVAHLRVMFAEAVDEGLIARSPVTGIKLPRQGKKIVVPPTARQVSIVQRQLPERYRSLVAVASATGMRQGELFGLTLDRVNGEGCQIIVDRQLCKSSLGLHLGPPKTPASSRTIPVPAQVIQVVTDHVDRFGVGPHGLVFTNDDGEPIDRTRFSDRWRPAARAAGLPSGQGMHSLRHFYASLLIHEGCSVKVVQARLGHATAAETLDTYAHLWHDDDDRTRRAVASGLEALIGVEA
jgi:integrase